MSRDHPRACGEQSPSSPPGARGMGSSPRVRGAAALGVDLGRLAGIIPARAGSSDPIEKKSRPSRDHPRACGEQEGRSSLQEGKQGSSPRVRGAVGAARADEAEHGIIPARAGSSTRASPSKITPWDHPRACGEQFLRTRKTSSNRGSSPRVRGAVAIVSHD